MPSISIPAKSILGRIFAANLVIPGQICDELLCTNKVKFMYVRTEATTIRMEKT